MAPADLDVITLLGSLDTFSPLWAIAHTLDEIAPDDVHVRVTEAAGNLPIFSEESCARGFPENIVAIGEDIRCADAVIIVTLEHLRSVPGGLQNALDWLWRLPRQPFANKPVAIQTASQGQLGGVRAQLHLRDILSAMGAVVLNKPEILIPHVATKIDQATGRLSDQTIRWEIAFQLENLVNLVRDRMRFIPPC